MAKRGLISMQLSGFEELAQALRDLGQDRLIKATMKRALLKAAQPMAADAAARWARGPNKKGRPHTADTVKASSTLSRGQRSQAPRPGPLEAVVYVGPGPRGPSIQDEFGTGPRVQKNGRKTGSMPAHPVMRQAFETHKYSALDAFGKELGNQIEASARRLAKRKAKAAK